MMFVPHRKHTCGPLRPVTKIALLFYMQVMFIPHSKHLRACTACYRDNFILYMQVMFVPHRKHSYEPPVSVTGVALLFKM
jgi:hypothetical protein